MVKAALPPQPVVSSSTAKADAAAAPSGSSVDFVLVTALPEERDALLDKLPGYTKLPPSTDDIRTYFHAELPVVFPGGVASTYQVIVVSLLGMGRIQAAMATADAIRRWHPRYVLLIGIAGGIAARDISLGDILISDQIVDYELQKITPQGAQVRWDVHRADPRLLTACNNFLDDSWQKTMRVERPDESTPKRHTGPIASGDKVVAFKKVMNRYSKTWPKLIGVEMEAAGVATATFQSPESPGFFMVRCTSDLADENKDSPNTEQWRSYACDAAASFTIAILKSGPVPVLIEPIAQAEPSAVESSSEQSPRIENVIEEEKRRYFTDRKTELDLFESLVRLTNSPLRTLGVHGGAGVGKSVLITEFKWLCKEWGIPYLSFDGYAQKDRLQILRRLSQRAKKYLPLSYFADFDRYLSLHSKMQRDISKDEEIIADLQVLLEKRDLERRPVIESSASESHISLLRGTYDEQDVDFFQSPEDFLTELLLEALSKAGRTNWVLFIDAYEKLSELDGWIRDHLVKRLPAFFRVVIAGRNPFEQPWHDQKRAFKSIHLLAFDEEDTKSFLTSHSIDQVELISEIFDLTKGHPLFLSLAALAVREDPLLASGHGKVSDDKYLVIGSIVRSFLKGIKDDRLREGIEICAVVRFFTEDTMSYFHDAASPSDLYMQIREYPFVKKQGYGFALHDAVWEYLNNDLKGNRPSDFRRMNEKAIEYYRRKMDQAGSRKEPWQPFALEIIYHKMTTDPDEALSLLVETYSVFEDQYRLDLCEALIREAQTHRTRSTEMNDWLEFLEARLANRQDNWEAARNLYQNLRQKVITPELGAYVCDGLGRVYYRLGEISKAEKLFSQALVEYESLDLNRGAAEVQYQIGKIKLAQRKWKSAKKALQDSVVRFDDERVRLSREAKSDYSRSRVSTIKSAVASVLSSLGTVYLSQGLWDQALDNYSEALEICQGLKDEYGIALSEYRVGWALQQKGNWDRAVVYYESSRQILVRLHADYRIARTIVKLADVYRLRGSLDKSEEVYLECMRICVKLKATIGIAVVLDSLGCLYQARGLLHKADIVHQKSLARKRQMQFPFEIELTLMNLGDLKAQQGATGEALDFYQESLKLMCKAQDRHGEALVLVKMCEISSAMSKPNDEIRTWIVRAESLSKRHKYWDIQDRIHFLQGIWHASAGNFVLAEQQFETALNCALEFNEYSYQNMRQAILGQSSKWPDTRARASLQDFLAGYEMDVHC